MFIYLQDSFLTKSSMVSLFCVCVCKQAHTTWWNLPKDFLKDYIAYQFSTAPDFKSDFKVSTNSTFIVFRTVYLNKIQLAWNAVITYKIFITTDIDSHLMV